MHGLSSYIVALLVHLLSWHTMIVFSFLFCRYFAAQSTRPIPQISTLNQSAQLTADELFFVFLLTKKMLGGLFAFSVFVFGETKPSLIFYRFWVGLVDRLFSGFGRRKNIISY